VPRRAEWRRASLPGAFLAGALLLLGARAAGQTPEELGRAREEFREALALQTAGDCASALVKFQSVGRVKMTPHVQFNIALCEERLGRLVAALGHYQLALSDAEVLGLDEVADPARRSAAALEARIPRLLVQRGAGAEGAVIELDGAPLGDTLLGQPLPRDPGSHVVSARFGDRVVFEQAFDLLEGAEHAVVVTAERRPPGAGPEPAEREPADVQPQGSTRRTIGYVAGGVGLASLVTAGVFIGLRQSAIGDLDRMCDGHACPPEAQPTIDRGRLYTGIAQGGVLLGVAGVSLGAVLLLGGDDAPASARSGPRLGVAIGGPGTLAGARVVGGF
jgi:hypothetical protein